jgi:hypothetical protein
MPEVVSWSMPEVLADLVDIGERSSPTLWLGRERGRAAAVLALVPRRARTQRRSPRGLSPTLG